MKRQLLKAVTSSILIMMSVSSYAKPDAKPTMNIEEKKVLATVETMTRAFESGNIEGVMNAYEKNAKVIFEPTLHITDKSQLRQVFKGASAIKPKFTYDGHEVFIADDLAIHIAPWVMTGKAPDGTAIEQNGLSVAVLRRQENGEWLMVLDNPNSDNLLKAKAKLKL